ncbi:hypothetical protein HPP92_020240 [Vanilla planifolia]|uniref:protein-serine/threonine phosphatase n=1 Tax=Vanilla planifolia TaxID=51239 RepID=A0A835ULV8_VANPL|nr:hypothetical protein HPP92_020240 [Vanilla planifolia]
MRMGSCLSWHEGGETNSLPAPSPALRPPGSGLKKARMGERRIHGSLTESAGLQDQLRRIPGRMFLNGASNISSLFTRQGRKGPNQDAMIVWENFDSGTGAVFCGVFDGHGPNGHMVARRVRDSLPLKVRANWEVSLEGDESRQNSICRSGSIISEATKSRLFKEESGSLTELEENLPEVYTKLKESFLKAFKFMDNELKLHSNIDCFCSGTTAATLVKQGQHLVIGNIGDSRVVLGTRNQNESLVAVQLTVDLKPDLPKEAERIRRCRGRVFAHQCEPTVARVWLPNRGIPGLAMARAFGDFCLKDFGLISVPEISYHQISKKDEFIVLASDGVWDVLSNQEVVDAIASAPAQPSAARFLVELAVRSWRLQYPTSKVDDCAAVILFLNTDNHHGQESSIETSNGAGNSQELPTLCTLDQTSYNVI